MPDDVVHLAGHPQPFLVDPASGRLLVGQRRGLPGLAQQRADQSRNGSHNHGDGQGEDILPAAVGVTRRDSDSATGDEEAGCDAGGDHRRPWLQPQPDRVGGHRHGQEHRAVRIAGSQISPDQQALQHQHCHRGAAAHHQPGRGKRE